MMKTYAIGKRNKPVRMFVDSDDISRVEYQLGRGEVYVEVPEKVPGNISKDGKSYIPAGLDMELEAIRIRETRIALLAASDWTQFPDAQLTLEEKEAWVAYRQALRDVPAIYAGKLYDEVVWPEQPN